MSDKLVRTADDPLEWFAECFRASANALGLTATEMPNLAGSAFRGGEQSLSTQLKASDLPSVKRGLKVDRYVIVLGVLPDTPTMEAVRETLRRYRNQLVVARSFLNANQALDLQLMLIGPRGSERLAEWRALALMVERDDRVARKLAWLRPDDAANDRDSFGDFLKRTFLARPWPHEDKFEVAPLDRLVSTNGTAVACRVIQRKNGRQLP